MKNYFRRYFNPMYQGGGIRKHYKATESEGGAPEIKELTDETDPENKALADDSEEVKSLKKISRQTKQFNTVLGTKAPKAEVDAALAEIKVLQAEIKTMKDADILKAMEKINEANTKIWQQIAEMQEEKAASKEAGNSAKKSGLNFTRKDVDDFVKTTFKDGKKTHDNAAIEVMKAAETFGIPHTFDTGASPTVIDAFTGRFVDPTLYQVKRKRNLILDNFTISTIDVPKLIYLIKVEDGDDAGSAPGDSGGADWILSGEIKPKRSFRVGTGEAEAKKVAIFGTIEDKLLKDVPSFERWIREDFMDEMKEEINDGLLNNDPAVNDKAPLGLKTNAVQFTASPAFANAYTAAESTYIDWIIAGIAAMAEDKEEAGQVFVSNDVYYKILALKDDNLRYQNNNLIYTSSLGQLYIAGVPIIRADSDDIPSTHVLITAVDLGFKMYAYGAMVFERGLNGEDFRYDRTSYRGYQEFLSFIPSNRENSVMYDTWANIQAGVEA